MPVKTYTALVQLTEDNPPWAIEVEGTGWTQARDNDEIKSMTRDLIATVLDAPEDSFEVEYTYPDDTR